MAYKQSPGRMNMPKTGAGIPSALTMPDPDPKDPKKKYGKPTVKKDKDEYGFDRITVSTPWSSTDRKTNKSYKEFAAEGGDVAAAKKFNKNKTSSGVETRTMTYGNAKPAGPRISVSNPEPKIDLSKKPSLPKNNKGYFYENKVVQEFGSWASRGRTNNYTDLANVLQKPSRSSFRPVTDRESQLMKSKLYNPRHHPMSNKKEFETHLRNIERFEKRKNDKKFARKKITDKRNADLNVKREALKAKQDAARAKKKK